MTVSKEWKFLVSFIRKTYNREVNEFFRDIDDEILDDINESRKAAKRACLILPKETMISALHKRFNFMYVCQRVQDRPEIYGMPVQEAQELFKFKPQVQLFFRQDPEAVPAGFRAIEGEISFRIMDKTSTNITEIYLKTGSSANMG